MSGRKEVGPSFTCVANYFVILGDMVSKDILLAMWFVKMGLKWMEGEGILL